MPSRPSSKSAAGAVMHSAGWRYCCWLVLTCADLTDSCVTLPCKPLLSRLTLRVPDPAQTTPCHVHGMSSVALLQPHHPLACATYASKKLCGPISCGPGARLVRGCAWRCISLDSSSCAHRLTGALQCSPWSLQGRSAWHHFACSPCSQPLQAVQMEDVTVAAAGCLCLSKHDAHTCWKLGILRLQVISVAPNVALPPARAILSKSSLAYQLA